MRRFLHDASRDLHRADEVTQSGNGTGFPGFAVHDRCVEFDMPGTVGRGATASDVQPAGFQLGDGMLDDVECASTFCKPMLTFLCESAQMLFSDCIVAPGDSACPTVQR